MSYRDSGPGEPQDQNDNWRGGGNFGGGGSGGGAGGGSGLGRDNWSPGGVGGRWSPAGYLGGGFGRPKSGVPPINWDDPRIKWTPVDTYDPLSSIRAPTNWDDPNIHWSPVGGNGIDQNVNKNNQGDPNHTADPGRMGPMAALPPALTPALAPAAHPAHQAFQSFFNNAIREGGWGGLGAMSAPSRSPEFSGGGAMSAPGISSGGWGGGQVGTTTPSRWSSFSRPSIFGSSGEGFFGDRR